MFPSPTDRRRIHAVLAGGLALYLLVRVVTLAGPPSSTAEVCEFGLLADQLSSGRVLALHQYPPLPRELLNIPYSMVCGLVFAISDSSMLGLRSCAVLWHGLILLVFASLAVRVAGWRGAALFALLWALPPPGVARAQQFGWSVHLESALIYGLAALCAARMLQARSPRGRWAWAGGAGVIGGLSLSLFVGSLPMVAALVAVTLVLGWRSARWAVAALPVGLVVGLCPAAGYRLLATDWRQAWEASGHQLVPFLLGWDAGAVVAPVSPTRALHALVHEAMSDAMWLPGLWAWAPLAGLAVMALLGISRRGHQRREDRRPRLLVLCWASLSVVLLVAASLFSGIVPAGRYLWATWPLAALSATVAADLPPVRRSARASLAALVAVALLLGGVSWALREHGSATRPDLQRYLKGYAYSLPVRRQVARLTPAQLRAAASRQTHGRADLYRIAGQHHGELATRRVAPSRWFAVVSAALARFPAAARLHAWEGAGQALAGSICVNKLHPRCAPDQPFSLEDYGLQVLQRGGFDRGQDQAVLFGMGAASWSVRHRAGLPPAGAGEVRNTTQTARSWAYCAGVAGGDFTWTEAWGTGQESHFAGALGCRPQAVAVGVGVALARWPDSGPRLAWFSPGMDSARNQAAFACAYRAERRNLALLARDDWLRQRRPAHQSLEACSR